MNEHYAVIIIGGRPAGASLAIRLGQRNIKTLLLDKAEFPSLPHVPSSPIFHPGTMRMLDQLGIPEADYTLPGGKIENYVLDFLTYFRAQIPVKVAGLDRHYSYGIDRNKFDNAMWQKAQEYPSVTARSGFAVTEIMKDSSGKVIGIKGLTGRGEQQVTITADLVVGADGRFSFAARQFDAKIVEERNEHICGSWHAEWENVADHDILHSMTMYNTVKGFLVLMIPIDQHKYIVCTYMRPDQQNTDKRPVQAYLDALQTIPEVAVRLKNAIMTTEVVGVKNIENGYREAYGNGWALVGDAFHYKDPLDGQGIYDALVETEALAEEIDLWLIGKKSWAEAGKSYEEKARAETHEMFLQTTARVKKEMHSDPPPFIVKTLIRWLLTSPEYQASFIRYLSRDVDPKKWLLPAVTPRAIWHGIRNDLFGRKPTPRPAVRITGEHAVVTGQ